MATAVGTADRSRRTAWVAGATGRLGDALVEQVLASGRYRRVSVLAPRTMATTVTGFEAVDLASLQQRLHDGQAQGYRPADPAHPAHCDDLYLLLDPDASAAQTAAAQANPRFAATRPAFEAVSNSDAALALATLAEQAGAQRMLLMAPLQTWQQLSRATRALPDGLELKLASLRIPLVVIMKPEAQGTAAPEGPASGPEVSAHSATGGQLAASDLPDTHLPAPPLPTPPPGLRQRLHLKLEAFSRFYLRQLRFMLPVSSVVIRSVDLARTAVEILTGPADTGLRIIDVEWLEDRLREKRGLRPRGRARPSKWRPQR